MVLEKSVGLLHLHSNTLLEETASINISRELSYAWLQSVNELF